MLPTPGSRRPRPLALLIALVLLPLAGVTSIAAPAAADEGHAPQPIVRDVIADVHTDAISTFWEDGALVLASKADTPEPGTRYEADRVWFHVDDDSKLEGWPAGYEFVAPAGSTVWLAPEVQASDQIWPGFSTESVPGGTLDNDDTTLTLVDVEGPAGGDVELWQTGSFAAINRVWSSDEEFKSFTRKRVHMHANWAFTEPGLYDLTVKAAATVDGTPVADTATYTFVVGELPADVATSTTLDASESEITDGDPLTLTAAVTPGDVEGYVEFRDEARVLGHDELEDGSAELVVPDLAVGTHNLSAVFVPREENLADTSSSEEVTVTVVDASGVEFAVAGVEESYEPGDTLSARVVGATLGENQVFRWAVRNQGAGSSGTLIPQSNTSRTFSWEIDALQDDTEISVAIYDTAARQQVSQTAWVPLVVEHQGGQPVINQLGQAHNPLLPGDAIDFEVAGRELGEGETLEWGFPYYAGYYGIPTWDWRTSALADDMTSMRFISASNPAATQQFGTPVVVSVVKDGVHIARSEFRTLTVGHRELNLAGHRTLYREGAQVAITATPYPVREEDDFTYTWTFTKGGTATVWGEEQSESSTLEGPQLTVAAHDGGSLRLALYNHGELAQSSPAMPIKVTDDLDNQILEFGALAGHYHQGNQIRLPLTVDPEPLAGDTLEWQWRWPGADWTAMPGVVDNVWEVTAEQALDGLEIRAVLTFADPEQEPVISDTRTVHVDDHGASPRQLLTVAGETGYVAGDEVTLMRELPENGQTILTDHRWEKREAGSDVWTVLEDESSESLSFEALAEDDGAQYRVSLLKPSGELAYGPSEPVTLAVEESTPVETSLSVGDVEQTYGRVAELAVTVDPEAPGTVSVEAGSRVVTSDLVDGQAMLRLPARSLEPGRRSVTVAYSGVPGEFQPSSTQAQVRVVKANPSVTVTAKRATVKPGKKIRFVVDVRAAGVDPTGKVLVRVAGRSQVAVVRNGSATVTVRVPKGTDRGATRAVATYRGDGHTTRGTAKTRIKVVR